MANIADLYTSRLRAFVPGKRSVEKHDGTRVQRVLASVQASILQYTVFTVLFGIFSEIAEMLGQTTRLQH